MRNRYTPQRQVWKKTIVRKIDIRPKNKFERWYQYIINTNQFWPAALLLVMIISLLLWILRDAARNGFDFNNSHFWPIAFLLLLLFTTAERAIGSQVVRRLVEERRQLIQQLEKPQ